MIRQTKPPKAHPPKPLLHCEGVCTNCAAAYEWAESDCLQSLDSYHPPYSIHCPHCHALVRGTPVFAPTPPKTIAADAHSHDRSADPNDPNARPLVFPDTYAPPRTCGAPIDPRAAYVILRIDHLHPHKYAARQAAEVFAAHVYRTDPRLASDLRKQLDTYR